MIKISNCVFLSRWWADVCSLLFCIFFLISLQRGKKKLVLIQIYKAEIKANKL